MTDNKSQKKKCNKATAKKDSRYEVPDYYAFKERNELNTLIVPYN
jgi:hypothetical protein